MRSFGHALTRGSHRRPLRRRRLRRVTPRRVAAGRAGLRARRRLPHGRTPLLPRACRIDGQAVVTRILFIGDIVGRPGRDLVHRGLAALVAAHDIDLVVANVENAAAGFGITREIGDQLLDRGVDVMTSGNHIWDKKEALEYIGAEARLLRPINYPAGAPGSGTYLARTKENVSVGVVNAMGRVFMLNIDDPFAAVPRAVEALRARARIVFVDFHAEATSEKVAMGWHLDGKVTAVVGTHTHVQTADERILPKGTAYLTDAGMTGPHDSVIGVEIEPALGRFLNALPARFDTATANPRLNGVVVEADEETGRAVDIERISYSRDEIDDLAGASS
ncbi:MAG: TIGR00282 family metallophosphoesterase [Acidobacteria bacterium]|nr:TIGR00282 family metallophosphoesterase [Acidobacteriota bacterium]